MKKEQKFKVGDKVKILKICAPFNIYLNQIGEIVQLNNKNDDLVNWKVKFKDGKCLYFSRLDFEKVENFKVEFKVGDKVKITNTSSMYFNDIGEILKSEKNNFNHLILLSGGEEFYFHYTEFEKIEEKQPINIKNQTMKTQEQIDEEIKYLEAKIQNLKQEKESQNFEVGDWFVANDVKTSCDYKNGNIYEIINITQDFGTKFLISRLIENGLNIKNNGLDIKNARKATPTEIEAHLIKLAEESGLIVGKTTKRNHFDYKIESIELFTEKDKISCSCFNFLKVNNIKYGLKWTANSGGLNVAYPFDYISYIQSKLQPKITINGYDAEFCAGYVKFGCAKFENEVFLGAKKFINKVCYFESNSGLTNRHVENIKLGAGIFTPTDIENIVKRLKD